MIFVILGTEKYPFDRLVEAIDTLAGNNTIDDDVFIQIGSCKFIPKNCRHEKFMSFEEMQNNIKKSKLIIAHAGAGTTLLCVQLGHRPIIVPRQKKLSEHVDDHQVSFSKKMETTGLVDVVYDIEDLSKHYMKHEKKKAIGNKSNSNSLLVSYLKEICQSWVD